jgi:hypothetical protein
VGRVLQLDAGSQKLVSRKLSEGPNPAPDGASLVAIRNLGGDLGGSIAPVVTGPAVERIASFAPAPIAIAAFAAVVYLVLVRSPIPAESLEG